MKIAGSLTVAAAIAALALAGCGGGGDDETTAAQTTTAAPERLTKAELIRQGDAICAEVNAAVGSIGASTADTETQIKQVSQLYTGMVENIKGLGRPSEAAGYDEFIEAAEAFASIEDEIHLAAERADTEALGDAATRATPALEEFKAQAEAYGFEECSQGPTDPSSAAGGDGGGEAVEPGGVEAAPEAQPAPAPEEAAPEEAPPTGGAGGAGVAPEGGGTGAGAGGGSEGGGSGGSSGGVGPG